MHELRMVTQRDIEGLKDVLDSIELFPSEMLDELIFSYLHEEECEEIWFTAIENEEMDFLYANPGVYSCIGTQVGATALGTAGIPARLQNWRYPSLLRYGSLPSVSHQDL